MIYKFHKFSLNLQVVLKDVSLSRKPNKINSSKFNQHDNRLDETEL